jgi:hypothetical protein
MAAETTEKGSLLQRRIYTQQALYYRFKGDKERMRMYLNLSRLEWMNKRFFLGGCPF